MEQIPVVSVNYVGLEKNPGLKFTPKLIFGVLYGCAVRGSFHARHHTPPGRMKRNRAACEKLYRKWNEIARKNVIDRSFSQFKKNCETDR